MGVYPPFFSIRGDKSEVVLEGASARAQMGIIGIMAPMAMAFPISVLAYVHLIGALWAYGVVATCICISLLMAAPFLTFDFAHILSTLLVRERLDESIAHQLRNIFYLKGSLSRPMLVAVLSTFIWLLLWLDCLRNFWEPLSNSIVEDIFVNKEILGRVGAIVLMAIMLSLLFFPVFYFLWNYLSRFLMLRKRRLVVSKETLQESLTFEERMTALEKIPLFAYLNDQERLSLLNEMSVRFVADEEYLVHQGEVGKEFFVLVRGKGSVMFRDTASKLKHISELDVGDAFGEIALIDDVPRTASVVSSGGCVVLVLSKEGFIRFCEKLGSGERVKTVVRLASFFRRHPFLSKLNAYDQSMLIDKFEFRTYVPGEEIPDPENDNNFYLIYSGKIRVDTGDDDTDFALEPDDCFGYSAHLRAKYYASDAAGLLLLPKKEFYSLIWEKLVERPELFI